VAFVGWFGYSIYDSAQKAAAASAAEAAANAEPTTTELNLTDFSEYMNGLDLYYE
jgi:hypothetical protein